MVSARPRLLTACVAASLFACAVPSEQDVAQQELAVVNGAADANDLNVVALMFRGGGQFCSGTLIAPRVVVTAAHCVPPALNDSIREETGNDPGITFADIDIFFGARVDRPGTAIPVAEGQGHPGFSLATLPDDIAVVALSADAPTDPKPLVSRMLGEGDYTGKTGRVVGFGLATPDGLDNGIKREGTTRILDADAASIWLDMDPSATCNGDSGGPLFMNVDGGEKFVGVHSRSDCVTDGNDERVDRHLADFVMPFVSAHGGGASGGGGGGGEVDCSGDGACNEDCAAGADPDCGGGGGGGGEEPIEGGPNALSGGCSAAPGGPSTTGLGLVIAVLLAGFVLHLRDAHGRRNRGRAHQDR